MRKLRYGCLHVKVLATYLSLKIVGFWFETFTACRKTFFRMNKKSPLSRSGRFKGGVGEDVSRFTESISFDQRLWRHDILGSIAHANMLGSIGVLSKAEAKRIVKALESIGEDIENGSFERIHCSFSCYHFCHIIFTETHEKYLHFILSFVLLKFKYTEI